MAWQHETLAKSPGAMQPGPAVDLYRPPSYDAQAAPSAAKPSFRQDIEGLRGVAVLLVVAFHCGLSTLRSGFVGVDVFFVLSGYLITGQLVAEQARTGGIGFVNFYARRVRRLLPAATLVLLTTLAAAAVLFAPQELVFAGRAGRAAAVYLTNVLFARDAADYFAPNVETNPILQMWTLAVEEQFYLVWPLLILIGFRWRSRLAGARLLAAVALVSFVASVWLTRMQPTFAFYQLPARAWEFAVGGLAALVTPGAIRSARVAALIGWLGLAAICVFSSTHIEVWAFPGWIAVIPVIGATAVLVAGHSARPVRVLHVTPLQYLGRLSYSWYLWHWPFLVFAAALFPGVSILRNVLAVLAALAVAAAAHRLIENPIRFHPRLVARPWATLAMGAALMTCAVAAAEGALIFASRLTHDPELSRIAAASVDVASMPREQCMTFATSAEVKTCAFGDTSSRVDVVLLGDSHATQWFNAMERVALDHHWRLTPILKSGCSAADATLPPRQAEFTDSCNRWRRSALSTIVGLRPRVVVVASSVGWRAQAGASLRAQTEEWKLATGRTLSALSPAAQSVVVLHDTPAAPFNVPTCLARSARHRWYPGGNCEFSRSAATAPSIFATEQQAAAGLSNVSFVDMTGELCTLDRCMARQDTVIAYLDDNHLTGAMSARLAPRLSAMIDAAIGPPGQRER